MNTKNQTKTIVYTATLVFLMFLLLALAQPIQAQETTELEINPQETQVQTQKDEVKTYNTTLTNNYNQTIKINITNSSSQEIAPTKEEITLEPEQDKEYITEVLPHQEQKNHTIEHSYQINNSTQVKQQKVTALPIEEDEENTQTIEEADIEYSNPNPVANEQTLITAYDQDDGVITNRVLEITKDEETIKTSFLKNGRLYFTPTDYGKYTVTLYDKNLELLEQKILDVQKPRYSFSVNASVVGEEMDIDYDVSGAEDSSIDIEIESPDGETIETTEKYVPETSGEHVIKLKYYDKVLDQKRVEVEKATKPLKDIDKVDLGDSIETNVFSDSEIKVYRNDELVKSLESSDEEIIDVDDESQGKIFSYKIDEVGEYRVVVENDSYVGETSFVCTAKPDIFVSQGEETIESGDSVLAGEELEITVRVGDKEMDSGVIEAIAPAEAFGYSDQQVWFMQQQDNMPDNLRTSGSNLARELSSVDGEATFAPEKITQEMVTEQGASMVERSYDLTIKAGTDNEYIEETYLTDIEVEPDIEQKDVLFGLTPIQVGLITAIALASLLVVLKKTKNFNAIESTKKLGLAIGEKLGLVGYQEIDDDYVP